MKWTNELPVEVGAYWFFDERYDEVPRVAMVRDFAGRLAEGNWVLELHPHIFWYGPILNPGLPVKNKKAIKEQSAGTGSAF